MDADNSIYIVGGIDEIVNTRADNGSLFQSSDNVEVTGKHYVCHKYQIIKEEKGPGFFDIFRALIRDLVFQFYPTPKTPEQRKMEEFNRAVFGSEWDKPVGPFNDPFFNRQTTQRVYRQY